MAQNWDDILATDTLRDSRQLILNRDETLKSSFSGTVFPTTDLVIGMPSYRTDQTKLHLLTEIGPDVWKQILLGVPVIVAEGGTGSTTAAGARTNLGLGALAILSAVDTAEIIDDSISTNKLQALAVTAAKLAVDAVETAKIKNLAVTGAKIASATITADKLAPGVGEEFPSGTRMLFQQTAAPTGWTKEAIHNDKALRLVTGTVGTGGTVPFSTVFVTNRAVTGTIGGTIDGHALTVAELPSHNHTIGGRTDSTTGGTTPKQNSVGTATQQVNTSSTGSGNSHTHTTSLTLTGAQVDIDVDHVDIIIAVKN